jgi:hypothetical protein
MLLFLSQSAAGCSFLMPRVQRRTALTDRHSFLAFALKLGNAIAPTHPDGASKRQSVHSTPLMTAAADGEKNL